MVDKQKVLVCGDVNGNFNNLFSRVDSISKKSGPFDLLICAGTFYGEDNSQLEAYRKGLKKVPVTTYVLGPKSQDEEKHFCSEGGELIPNVVYIGKRGLFSTSSDLKIAYLSGVSKHECKESNLCSFNADDCAAVRDACIRGQAEYRGIDVLVTSIWPNGVQYDKKHKMELSSTYVSELVAWLAVHLKARYHFVASPDKYYERQPYRNLSVHQDYREIATRFIGLAPVGNKEKEKWIYACSLQPISKMRMTDLLQATTDETECPFDVTLLKQPTPGKIVKYTGNGQFFYNMDSNDDGHGNKRKNWGAGNREKKKIEFDPNTCWFCLSSPTVERHLVISVGSHCYLALAKGPLTPDHVLILPITHHQATTQVPDEVNEEIKKFKESLMKMFASLGQLVVFFERNFKTSHLQIQCVPVPKIAESQLLEVFQDEAGIQGVQLDTLPPYSDICQIIAPGTPYFHTELPTGDQLFARTKHTFPLQFGRDVLSSSPILDCEDKADWRQCQLTKEEEIEHVANFREKYKKFDFTLDEDDSN